MLPVSPAITGLNQWAGAYTAAIVATDPAELTTRLLAAFSGGEIEEVLTFFSPEVRWTTATDEPDHQTYEGRDGVRKLHSAWSDLWESGFEADIRPASFTVHGTHVVVPVRVEVRGRGSGVEVEVEETYVFSFAGEEIARVREFRTEAEALAALEDPG